MISVSGKCWEEISVNKRLLDKVKIDNNFSEILSKLIIYRNFSNREIYSIENNVDFTNPFLKNNDFKIAAEILKKNIDNQSKILVIGDYDVDGCISTSLIINFLNKHNINSSYYIPDRLKDGYGASIKLIKKLVKEKFPKLIIMVDCGSNSNNSVEFLKNNKIDSIIIDHHNISKPYPKANIVINPKKECDYRHYDYYCSAFLTYLFLDFYNRKNNSKITIADQLIYVALATLADVMPLRENNRFLLKKIIKRFDINKNLFFKMIFKLNNLNKKLDFDDLSYIIAPTINSAGRISNANNVIKLLTSSNEKNINEITNKLFEFNKKRKIIENIVINKIKFKKLTHEKGIIFYFDNEIPEGIIGIIASKLKEFFNKPAIVFTKSKDLIKGSARSVSSFNIGQYINRAINNKILISGGGHNLAAGLTLQKKNIDKFKNFLNEIYTNKNLLNSNKYISKISFSSINMSFFEDINKLAPFGNQNNKIIFLIENVKIIKPFIIKEKFISCFVKSKTNKLIKAISFNPIESSISLNLLNQKKEISILAKMNKNNWNNKTNIQLEIVDVICFPNNT